MRLARDEVRTQWFPAGTCIVEQGEPADALYLILNGTADALLEHPDGQLTHMRRMQAGDFFGELGLVAGAGERTAHVVASESLTCLLLSRTPISQYAGRGAGATRTAEPPAADVPRGVCAVDVTSHLHRKLAALARHRTQYPIVPSMLPQSLLQSMLGTEFFRRTADGSEPGQSPVARYGDQPDDRFLQQLRRHHPDPRGRAGVRRPLAGFRFTSTACRPALHITWASRRERG